MHAHMINYDCFCHHYFNVFALQVISFIITFIQSIISRSSELSKVVCFEWIQCLYGSTHSIFLMHSNSYFITHIYYLIFWFYHIPTTIFTVKIQAPKDWLYQVFFTAVRKANLLLKIFSFAVTKSQQHCSQSVFCVNYL